VGRHYPPTLARLLVVSHRPSVDGVIKIAYQNFYRYFDFQLSFFHLRKNENKGRRPQFLNVIGKMISEDRYMR